MTLFWLRREYKKNERRTLLTPEGVRALVAAGHTVTVERFADRCFADADYAAAGATMVEPDSWQGAPGDAVIVGLKELPPNDTFPLTHTHLMFGHCYKNQAEDVDLLTRFRDGKGTLLDLEFMVDPASGRRVAAFGVSAGFNGAVVGVLAYVAQHGDRTLSRIPYADSFEEFAGKARRELDALCASGTVPRPRVHVMGALGRCGRGARQACALMGLETVDWDMAETASGGPFPEMLQSEILLNAILLDAHNPPPPFLTSSMIAEAGTSRRLRVFVDVSCDTSNPTNPVPIYNTTTTFDAPCLALDVPEGAPPLDVVAIDHLPSLVPAESSREFAGQMLPYLVSCNNPKAPPEHKLVWKHVQDLYTSELKRVMAKRKRQT